MVSVVLQLTVIRISYQWYKPWHSLKMKDFKNNNMIGARTLDIVIMMDAKHCGCCYGVMI